MTIFEEDIRSIHDGKEDVKSIHNGSAKSFLEQEIKHKGTDATPVIHNEEYVFLSGKKYLKDELMYAFGGHFNPGVQTAPRLKLGNSTPMGLFAFATTTLILSLVNAGSRGVDNYNVMLGCAVFYGGVVQLIAGVWELIVENTFGATVFTAFGGFWLSFAVITMDGFNITSSYSDPSELANALGLFFLVWALVTIFFTLMTLRSTVAMFLLFLSLAVTFILLASAQFTAANGSATVSGHLGTAAGVFGCWTAMCSYYNGLAGILTKENSWINIRPLYMPGAIRPKPSKQKEA